MPVPTIQDLTSGRALVVALGVLAALLLIALLLDDPADPAGGP